MKKYQAINAMKLFAILLVFNSHCDEIYPISSLASGGGIANSLFFIISGYLVKVDTQIPVINFWIQKMKRLYPEMLFMTVIYMIAWSKYPSTILGFVNWFIFPMPFIFWFGTALAIFYLLIYYFEKYNLAHYYKIFSFGMLIFYMIMYIIFVDKTYWSIEEIGLTSFLSWFKCIHYYYIFTLGYYLKKSKCDQKINDRKGLLNVFAFVLLCGIWIMSKLILIRFSFLYRFQFVIQGIDIACAYTLLIGCLNIENLYCRFWNINLRRFIDQASRFSFEIYLTQHLFIEYFKHIKFPMSFLGAVSFTILSAMILFKLNDWFQKNVCRKFS